MKNKTLRKVVTLLVTVCLLIGLMPLMKIINTMATSILTVKVNTCDAKEGANLEEIIKSQNIGTLSSLEVSQGELSPDDIKYLNENGKSTLKTLTIQNISIADNMFKDYTELETVSLPKVTSIKASSFANCSKLKSLTLGENPPTTITTSFQGYSTDITVYVPLDKVATYDTADGSLDSKWNGWKIESIPTVTPIAPPDITPPSNGTATPAPQVTVSETKPTVIVTPLGQTAYVGDTVTLTANATPYVVGKSLTYQWKKDNVDTVIGTEHNLSQTLSELGSHTYTVTVNEVDAGTATASATITVIEKTKQNANISLHAQKDTTTEEVTLSATLSQTGDVVPTGTVTFKVNEIPLAGGTDIPLVNAIASCKWTPTSYERYTLSVKYSGDDIYNASLDSAYYTMEDKRVPEVINTKDITVITIVPPVTGAKPQDKIIVGAHYKAAITWIIGSSPIQDSFFAGKIHKANVVLTADAGYRFASDATANIISRGAVITGNKVEGTHAQNTLNFVATFPRTENPNKLNQTSFEFDGTVPIKKTYGNTDFALSTKGGSGDGAISFISSNTKVLTVTTSTNGIATVKIVGGGTATITAKKAQGVDATDNQYNEATATTPLITVAPVVLTATANDKTIKVGTTSTVYTVRVTGFINGDTETNLVGFVAPTATSAGTELGVYEIVVSGGKPTDNYTFKYLPGKLTVNSTGVAPSSATTSNSTYAGDKLKNDNMGVTVETTDGSLFNENTKLSVENVTKRIDERDKKVYDKNILAQSSGKELAGLYNIKLLNNNGVIQPDGKVKVTINLTNEINNNYRNLEIVYIDNYGKVTTIPHEISADSISFITDHFSNYGIIGTPINSSNKPSVNPQTGDDMMIYVVIIMGIIPMVAFALTSNKFRKKKKI